MSLFTLYSAIFLNTIESDEILDGGSNMTYVLTSCEII